MALQDTLGMSTAVIVSPGGYGRNYSLLADVLTKYPGRFRGIALLRDDTPSSEIGRLTKLGVRGMRMMSHKRGQHVPNYSPRIAARVHEHGWHIQFYPHGTDIAIADKLWRCQTPCARPFRRHPARAASISRRDGGAENADSGRVWLKLSADALHRRAAALSVADAAGARLRQARAGSHGVGLGLAARQPRRHGDAKRRRPARSAGRMGAGGCGAQPHPDAKPEGALRLLISEGGKPGVRITLRITFGAFAV
jgi:hypothetical protein